MNNRHFTFQNHGDLLQYDNRDWQRTQELWRGKSAESSLYSDGQRHIVIKRFVSREENYISLKDALSLELGSYEKLRKFEVPVPELLSWTQSPPILMKEFVPGPTVMELLARGHLDAPLIEMARNIAQTVESKGWNIDYFPANFVYQKELNRLVYIDYEIQPFTPEWSFENWGSWYWFNHPGFQSFLKSGDGNDINQKNSFHPLKTEDIIRRRMQFFAS
ncbi:hypothetical protein [Salinispira pacifica]|uniref:Serine/threonine protein kinase n=1 Tax=Salinispira pacifica TaxID=1307761 RepID=V5WND0_9SPIO|nr:hypothetical protein [Salinispira pacifica]AHC16749.1 hypothetical protein L21SP2_3411 [Salinispira pacifica]